MSETILTYDEEESRRATERQMAATARDERLRRTLTSQMPDSQPPTGPPPVTYGGPTSCRNCRTSTSKRAWPQLIVAAPIAEHLLVDARRPPRPGAPGAHAGRRKASAAGRLPKRWRRRLSRSIVQAFGITLTDLRESEEPTLHNPFEYHPPATRISRSCRSFRSSSRDCTSTSGRHAQLGRAHDRHSQAPGGPHVAERRAGAQPAASRRSMTTAACASWSPLARSCCCCCLLFGRGLG